MTLYDAAWQSFTVYTKLPVRAVMLLGWLLLFVAFGGAVALALGVGRELAFGMLLWFFPLFFALTGLVLISIGVLGEYVLTLREKVMRRPLVVEERRVGFDMPPEEP